MNLWMVYACNIKGSVKYSKDDKKVNALCIVDWNYQRSLVVVNHSRNFKSISLMMVTIIKNGEILSKKEEIQNWKKES